MKLIKVLLFLSLLCAVNLCAMFTKVRIPKDTLNKFASIAWITKNSQRPSIHSLDFKENVLYVARFHPSNEEWSFQCIEDVNHLDWIVKNGSIERIELLKRVFGDGLSALVEHNRMHKISFIEDGGKGTL